jgi:hypothetical protein
MQRRKERETFHALNPGLKYEEVQTDALPIPGAVSEDQTDSMGRCVQMWDCIFSFT